MIFFSIKYLIFFSIKFVINIFFYFDCFLKARTDVWSKDCRNAQVGVHKVPYSPWRRGGGKFTKSVGEEYQVVERGNEYQGCGEEYYAEKKWYDIEVVSRFYKNGDGEKDQVVGNFTHPCSQARTTTAKGRFLKDRGNGAEDRNDEKRRNGGQRNRGHEEAAEPVSWQAGEYVKNKQIYAWFTSLREWNVILCLIQL